MSGAGGGGGGGGARGLYGDDPTAAGFSATPLDHDDVDGFFFFQRPPCAGEGGGDGITAAGYSSITDYLQGFLDPAGMAATHCFDAPCRLAGEDAVLKQEMVVQVSGHDGGQAGAPVTASSPVLSSSREAAGGEEEPRRRRCKKGRSEEGEEEIDDEGSAADRNCKRSKEKKRGENKKAWEPRVAFMTKSEVDHLEDGYRWRKYGQKTVKDSSYPRSYYRCTAARCGVKKRVERSQQDPSTVVTTYQGQHTHPSPVSLTRAGTARVLMQQPINNGYSPLQQLGFRADLAARAMTMSQIGYARSSPAGLPPPMRLLQGHRASQQLPTYGGAALGFVHAAMSNGNDQRQ